MLRPLYALNVNALLRHLPQRRYFPQTLNLLPDQTNNLVYLLVRVKQPKTILFDVCAMS